MPSTSADTIQWEEPPVELAADPVATFDMDRPAWERLGATFTAFDDDLGGTSYLAAGRLAGLPGGVIGILGQEDEDTTFLLLAEADRAAIQIVLDALFAAGVERTALLELLPTTLSTPIEQRVDELEQLVHGLIAERAVTEVPAIQSPEVAKALSHPVRVEVLGLLEQGPASPSELSAKLGVSLGSVAYHMRTLLGLGLIELAEERRRRGAVEHFYRAKRPLARARVPRRSAQRAASDPG